MDSFELGFEAPPPRPELSDDESDHLAFQPVLADDEFEVGFAALGPQLQKLARPAPAESINDAVENAWKRAISLRCGDGLNLSGSGNNANAGRHRISLDYLGYFRESWNEVGARSNRRSGDISSTTRHLDMLCSLARSAQVLTLEAMSDAQNS